MYENESYVLTNAMLRLELADHEKLIKSLGRCSISKIKDGIFFAFLKILARVWLFLKRKLKRNNAGPIKP